MRIMTATAVALLALASPVAAQTDEICVTSGKIAHSIMRNRQSGVPLSEAMSILDGQSAAAANLLRAMIIEAYSQPDFMGDEMKERQLRNFVNDTELACYKTIGKPDE